MKFEIKCVNNLVYGNIYIWILKDYIFIVVFMKLNCVVIYIYK